VSQVYIEWTAAIFLYIERAFRSIYAHDGVWHSIATAACQPGLKKAERLAVLAFSGRDCLGRLIWQYCQHSQSSGTVSPAASAAFVH